MVDLVLPYVNGDDKVWQKTFDDYIRKYRIGENRYGTRFNDMGLFPYQLKLISKFMPFINTIHILVSNKEQLDGIELPSNAKVVLHKDFIPIRYLPTFNSTTIEMFIWNIPNLAERFIYINDDMLPIAPLKETDFFTPANKVKVSFLIGQINKCHTQFRQVCYKQYQEIKDSVLDKAYAHQFSKEHYFRPVHSFTPMLLSHCKETYKKYEQSILLKLSPFRTNYNHNQYIYPLYELLCLKNTIESKIPFVYTEINKDTIETVNYLRENTYKIICINDARMTMRKEIDFSPVHKELERRLSDGKKATV